MPKLKEISELIDSDPSLGEQISVFENEKNNNNNINTNVAVMMLRTSQL